MKTIRPILVGVALALSAAGVNAQLDSSRPVSLLIKRQILRDALNEWAQQTGCQLISPASEAMNQLMAPAISGTMTPGAALARILSGTSYTYRLLDERTVLIVARPTSPVITSWQPRPSESMGQQVAYVGDTQSGARIAEDHASKDQGLTKANNEARESQSERMEEVLVTAQKREERLQDVPISISVLGGDDLDKATAAGISSALNSVPGVVAQESYIGGGTQLTIRGVSAASTILHGSSPIAYYLDSIPFGLIKNSVAPDSNAYDMERVEILRGPQGTLYGASALNGVVRVLTKNADLDKFDFKVRTSGSSTEGGGGNYRGDAAMNVPIVEGKLAARAVVGYDEFSGWIDRPNEDDANDARSHNYRLKVNGQPSESLSITASAWKSSSDHGSSAQAGDDERNSAPINEPMFTDYETYGLRIGYDFGAGSISSMTGYLDYHNGGVLELTPLGIPGIAFISEFFGKVVSQEINIDYALGERWRWTVGGIYRDAEDRNVQQYPNLLPTPSIFTDQSKSYAVFGEVTRLFLEGRLELTAGLRYFEDDVGTTEISSLFGVPAVPIDVSSRFNKTTPRVVLNWHPSSQITTYASYAEGFRSGFQQAPPVIRDSPEIPPVGADSLKNYELGIKGRVLDGRLGFDTALYFIDWQDVQSNNVVLINGIPAPAVVNGQSASGLGFDLSVTASPLDQLELSIGFSANDLTWDESSIPGTSVSFSKGDRLNLSPKYTASGSATYTFSLGSGGYEALISASARYNSEQFFRIASGSGQADSILIADARFSIEAPSNWTITLYGDNLNDEDGTIQQAPFNVEDWSVRPRPRTIGLQLEYRL
jgi:iron complex outermembrane receptor protein